MCQQALRGGDENGKKGGMRTEEGGGKGSESPLPDDSHGMKLH